MVLFVLGIILKLEDFFSVIYFLFRFRTWGFVEGVLKTVFVTSLFCSRGVRMLGG